MQRTRVMAIGTGLVVGGLLGGAAGMAGWRTPVAAAQEGDGEALIKKLVADPVVNVQQDEREARAKKAIDLARRIADVRAEFHAAMERKQADRADKLEAELHELAGALRRLVGALRENGQEDALEMVERTLRADGKPGRQDKKKAKPEGQPRDKKRAEGGDDELAAGKKKLQDLEAKIRATEEQLARAEAEGREDEARKLRIGLNKLRERFADGRERLERAHAEGPRKKGDRRDGGDAEAMEQKLHAVRAELERAHGNIEEYEQAIRRAREAGEEAAVEKYRAGLERVIAHARELKGQQAEIEGWFRQQQDERARDRRERDDRPRVDREPPSRGREGAPAEELHRELRAIREEVGALRQQMAEMRDLLARLLHERGGPEGDRREGGPRGERGERDRRPDGGQPGRFPGLPGLPSAPGHESLAPYFEALRRANEWFREMGGRAGRDGMPERAVDAINQAHAAYAKAMATYQRAVLAAGDRGLGDDLRMALDEARERLHHAMERAAGALRGAGEDRRERDERRRDREREEQDEEARTGR